MKILMHVCCGPCSIVPTRRLKAEEAELYAYFDNPNVQPFTEWRKRLDAALFNMEREGVPMLKVEEYDVTSWLREVVHRESRRCRLCYSLRLRSAAKIARKGKFDGFTTTLLYSRFQNHDLIREMGEEAAAEAGVPFLYRDWRDGWSEGVEESRRLNMYRQQYCGCIYSEEERYRGKSGGEAP